MRRSNTFAIVCGLAVTVAVAYVTNFGFHYGIANGATVIGGASYTVGEGFADDNEIIATCAAVPNVRYTGWPFTSKMSAVGCAVDGKQTTLYPYGIALNLAIAGAAGAITFAIITLVRRNRS